MDLTDKKCVPCEGGTLPMAKPEADKYMAEVLGWAMADDGKSIRREFSFADFRASMAFVNKVAEVAEGEGHHPDIYVFYNKVRLELSTHAIGGLSENDFIVAAKVNRIS